MRKVLALLALLPMLSFGAQMATKEYVDRMKIEAVDGATRKVEQILPGLVGSEVDDYMAQHGIPTVITNKETIIVQTNYVTHTDHYETNYTHEVITRDITYNIHSNTYFDIHSNTYIDTYISTNYIDATGFAVSPDGTKAISGDLRMYNASLSPVKKVIDGFPTYSTIIDESTGLHYVPMSVYDLSAVYFRYQCVENPLGTTGSGSSMRYKAGLNLIIQASGVKSYINLYNDSGTSIGQTPLQLISDIDSGRVKWSVGDHVFSFSDRIYTFTPNGDSVLTSNDVERIISERVPPPVPADRIYDSIEDCWNQYLKGDLKIYDSQDNLIGEVATKSNLDERVSEIGIVVSNSIGKLSFSRLYNEAVGSADSVNATIVYEAHYGGYAESVEGLYRLRSNNVYSESLSNIVYNLEFLGGTEIQDASYPDRIKMEYNKVTRKFHLMATDHPTWNDGQFYNYDVESFFPMGITNLVYTAKTSQGSPYPTVKFKELSHTKAEYLNYMTGDGTMWHRGSTGDTLTDKAMTESTMRKWIQSGKLLGAAKKVEYDVYVWVSEWGGTQVVRGWAKAQFDTLHRKTTDDGAVFRGTITGCGFGEGTGTVEWSDPEVDLVYNLNTDEMSLRTCTTNFWVSTGNATIQQKTDKNKYFPNQFVFTGYYIMSKDRTRYNVSELGFYNPVESYMD